MKKLKTIITCEHAVNTIPPEYSNYFASYQTLLNTHRGIDFGAAYIGKELAQTLDCPYFDAKISRLLIDYNRSLTHSRCWSEISLQLTKAEKNSVIQSFYLPYRQAIISQIQEWINQQYQVLHISAHSFTPILNQIKRETEVGLLYDPARVSEKQFASKWAKQFKKETRELRIRFNYPYQGTSDGFTTSLRKLFSAESYIGIELESNQALTVHSVSLTSLTELLKHSLINALSE